MSEKIVSNQLELFIIVHFDQNGIIENINDNFTRIFGYTKNEVIGRHHSLLVEENYASSQDYKIFLNNIFLGHHQSSRNVRVGKDGKRIILECSYIPVTDNSLNSCGFIKIARVVDSLPFEANSERFFKIEMDNIVEFDQEGFIIFANDNFLALFNYTKPEINGLHRRDLCDSEYAKSKYYNVFWEKVLNTEYLYTKELNRFGKHGESLWINCCYERVRGSGGEIIKIIKHCSRVDASLSKENRKKLKLCFISTRIVSSNNRTT
jgi:methyl-accepting chemotaxis protein